MRDWITVRALGLGVAVPFLYYGIQAAAAPFFPGFSFLTTIASDLGSDRSTCPWAFNAGIMVVGVLCLIASAGFLLALVRVSVRPILAVLVSLAVALIGMMMLWGGYYPLPDPRHEGHFVFFVGLVSLPSLLTVALWGFGRSLRHYLVANLVLWAVMEALVLGVTGIDTHGYRGILQRIFALSILPPIGVAAHVLTRRLITLRAEIPSLR